MIVKDEKRGKRKGSKENILTLQKEIGRYH